MQILLNLLPQEKKEALSSRFHFRFFMWQTALLLLLELLALAALIGIFFVLNYQIQTKESANKDFEFKNSQTKQLVEYRSKFKEANTLALDLSHFTKNHFQWSRLFLLLDHIVPSGIILTNLSTENYTIILNGESATRDDFLIFENNLKSSDCVSDVKVPISNLFSETEIEFQVRFNVKPECLLKKKS